MERIHPAPVLRYISVHLYWVCHPECPINGRNTIDVKLAVESKELAQVVVVGYGTQRKIDVSGYIATVKGEDLSSQPDANPISALQGKVAGVQITNSGTPGTAHTN